MQKIAILGGTFNPIHKGHIKLAQACHQVFSFDRILIIPTNKPPHKRANDLCSNEDRFTMCRLAVEGDPLFEVSDIEFRLGGISYTYLTLGALKEEYPDAEFYLLVGSDMYYTFTKWKRYRDILKMCTLVGASRNPMEHDKMLKTRERLFQKGFDTVVVKNDVFSISSTELRDKIKSGIGIEEYIEPSVFRYIREHDLYGESYGDENDGF